MTGNPGGVDVATLPAALLCHPEMENIGVIKEGKRNREQVGSSASDSKCD